MKFLVRGEAVDHKFEMWQEFERWQELKYKSPVVQAEWEAWQAAYFAGLSAGHQEDTAAIEREARKL